MTTLQELLQERDRYAQIVKRKKMHLKECKKVLNFYVRQVRELERKIKEQQWQKNT